jgi:acetoin:2,6-dichlorophenolindophenol oxidoreductase subunit alpha
LKENVLIKGKVTDLKEYKIADRFKALDKNKKIEMLKKMYQIRHFENEVEHFILKGEVYGTCHLYIGEEANAVGAISAIRLNDWIVSHHRGHGHCIAKDSDLNLMMSELIGRGNGYCKGKGGSMHIADMDKYNLGANGIVGGGMGIAVGAALTSKLKKNDGVVVCFIGDASTNNGIFHESVNLASIWNLPLIYFCENNQYGMSTSIISSTNIERLSDRKASYGITGLTIDGNNIIEVYNVVSHFAELCRNGKGPILIESLTYRWKGHSKHDSQNYRTKEEVEKWKEYDPILRYKEHLIEENIVTADEVLKIENKTIAEIKNAADFAEKSAYPDLKELETDVYAN